jgi:hypothetical protein
MYAYDMLYVAMLVIMATLSTVMVPLGWHTDVDLSMSTRAYYLQYTCS